MSTVTARIVYGQALLKRGRNELDRLPLAAPINDLLGILGPHADERYVSYLVSRYGSFGQAGESFPWDKERLRREFLAAAKTAQHGHIAAVIAPHLERVQFNPGRLPDVAPDFEALAAWSLSESMRRGQLKLFTCPMCKAPWLGSPGGPRYCQRRAPGQLRDCRTLAAERRLAGDSAYRAYRREYKRLAEAFRTNRISAKELVGWRQENGPARWLPFDQWKQRKKQTQRKEDE
jgi:hypothetical protein